MSAMVNIRLLLEGSGVAVSNNLADYENVLMNSYDNRVSVLTVIVQRL